MNANGPIESAADALFSGTPHVCMGCMMTPREDTGMTLTLIYRTGQDGAMLWVLCPECSKLRFEGARGALMSRSQAYKVARMLHENARIRA